MAESDWVYWDADRQEFGYEDEFGCWHQRDKPEHGVQYA